MSKIKVMNQVIEAMRLCQEAGRKPIVIVMNPASYSKLIDELKKEFGCRILEYYHTDEHNNLMLYDMRLILNSVAKDFFIVDDRSWAEQKW